MDEYLIQNQHLLPTTDDEGVDRVANGSYAFLKVDLSLINSTEINCFNSLLQGKSYLEYAIEADFLETGKCRLALAKKEFYYNYYGFPLTKGSPFQTPLTEL